MRCVDSYDQVYVIEIVTIKIVSSCSQHGEIGDIWSLGLSVYTLSIILVTLRLANRTRSFTLYHVLSILFSIIIWLGTIYFLSLSYQWSSIWTNIKPEGIVLYASPKFWLMLALSPIVAFIPEVTFAIFKIHKSPMDSQIMREMEHGYIDGVYVKGHTNFVEQVIDPTSIQGGREEEGSLIDEEDSISGSLTTEKSEEHTVTHVNGTSNSKSGVLSRTSTWHEVADNDKVEDSERNGFQVAENHVGVPTTDTFLTIPSSQHGKISFGYSVGSHRRFISLKSPIQAIYLQVANPLKLLNIVHIFYMVSQNCIY